MVSEVKGLAKLVGLKNSAGTTINPATEDKQDDIVAELKAPQGSSSQGTVALASANTWYSVPPAGSIPAVDYELHVAIENAVGVVRVGVDDASPPSATNGNRSPGYLVLKMKASTPLYFGSDTAGDDINWLARGQS